MGTDVASPAARFVWDGTVARNPSFWGDMMNTEAAAAGYEVAIVGGGPAGLQAPLVLGRARRRVVIVDAEEASHFAADAVHGALGFESVPPRELRKRARAELEPFNITHICSRVTNAARHDKRFDLQLSNGSLLSARVVILAGGLRYFPSVDVPGLEPMWGSRVFHCPFCHGWEVRGKRIAVIGSSPEFVEHGAALLRLWSDDVIPILDGVTELRERENEGVEVHHDGAVTEVDAVLCSPRLEVADDLPDQLALRRFASPPMFVEPILVESDDFGATSEPGVFAAGDLTTGFPTVATALASGSQAAVGAVRYLAAP